MTEVTLYIKEGQENEQRIRNIGAKFLKAKMTIKVVGLTEEDVKYMNPPPYVSTDKGILINMNEMDDYIKKYRK